MPTLQLEIVTPEKKAYEAEVDSVVLPAVEGEMGILPNHMPLMTAIQAGEIRVMRSGKEESLAVGEGFVEVSGNKVSVLTEAAITIEDIDEGQVEEAIKRAQEALATAKSDPDEVAALAASIARSTVQLQLKRKKRA
ncbi:MAG: ATP synthase F1 subunit epsilon [Blastochloris sp.]|nr:ATP synthase F1 subunit epsilon [Blastochloris sp.]